MDSFWQDLRYGLRGLRNQPTFAVLAVLTLALGIGAATTIFSVIQNVLLDPFPYKDANRVVAIRIHDATNPNPFEAHGAADAGVPRLHGAEPRLRGRHRRHRRGRADHHRGG